MNKIRKGDDVAVLTGKDKGKRGTVLRVLKTGKVVVEGVNVVKRHTKPNPTTNTPGGISLPFGCAPWIKDGGASGFTQEWAIVNYMNVQVTEKDSFSLRNEYMDDTNGQRTGTATLTRRRD